MADEYVFKRTNGHIEVYLNGEFQFSADTMKEVWEDLLNDE